MGFADDIQTDFGNIVDEIGTPVTVFELYTSGGKGYSIYGDYSFSGNTLYVSGETYTASIQPRNQEDEDIREFSKRTDGNMIGYFKSGADLGIGYRVSGTGVGDYKINALSAFTVSGVICYHLALLDVLNK